MYVLGTTWVAEMENLESWNDEYRGMLRIPDHACSPAVRVCVVVVAQLDDERVLADVGGDALELEGLEAGPTKEGGVGGCKFPEGLGDVLVGIATGSSRGFHLRLSVLADGSVRGPVDLLAVL